MNLVVRVTPGSIVDLTPFFSLRVEARMNYGVLIGVPWGDQSPMVVAIFAPLDEAKDARNEAVCAIMEGLRTEDPVIDLTKYTVDPPADVLKTLGLFEDIVDIGHQQEEARKQVETFVKAEPEKRKHVIRFRPGDTTINEVRKRVGMKIVQADHAPDLIALICEEL